VIGIRRTRRSSRPRNASPRGGRSQAGRSPAGRSRAAAIAVVVFATVALALAGAGPAQAGLDGPLATNIDQHCVTKFENLGQFTLIVPTDRVTVTVEAVDHAPVDQSVRVTYAVPGSVATTTLTGHFDANRHNVTFTFDLGYPTTGATLQLSSGVTWSDGTTFADQFNEPLLGCTQSPQPAPDLSSWDNFLTSGVTQVCGNLPVRGTTGTGIGSGIGLRIPYDRVSVTIGTGTVYDPGLFTAGASVWADYWVTGGSPSSVAYTSGNSGTFPPSGAPITLTFTILAPPASGELNVLTSVRDGDRTFPAHNWVPIAC
jgi:hypothetical protein